jgi:hypothetical protein
MFYSLTAFGLHGALGSPSGTPALAAVLASMLFLSSMVLWVLADARLRHRTLPYDFGSFVFFAWPLVVPIYLFSTRGLRAFVPLGFFLLIYLAAALVSSIPFVLHSMRQ